MAQWDCDRKDRGPGGSSNPNSQCGGQMQSIQKQGHSLEDTRCGCPVPHEEEGVGLTSSYYVFLCVCCTKPGFLKPWAWACKWRL